MTWMFWGVFIIAATVWTFEQGRKHGKNEQAEIMRDKRYGR